MAGELIRIGWENHGERKIALYRAAIQFAVDEVRQPAEEEARKVRKFLGKPIVTNV